MTNYGAWSDNWSTAPDLWEHQGRPMTVRDLKRAIDAALAFDATFIDLPVRVGEWQGETARALDVMEFGFVGTNPSRPDAVVFAVIATGETP